MNTKKIVDWSQFLPKRALPNTGDKDFKPGQVYAVCSPNHEPFIAHIGRVEGQPGNRYADYTVLAGNAGLGKMATDSLSAYHSVLLADEVAAVTQAEVVPQWLRVVERVMTKARAHADAGREDQFTQVFVPKEDYLALKEHFCGDDPWLATAVGLIGVYPVNPDGATFSD